MEKSLDKQIVDGIVENRPTTRTGLAASPNHNFLNKEKAMAQEIISKKCSRCKEDKLLSEFSRRSNRKSGYEYHCKKCHSKTYEKWYNSEKGKATLKCYQQTEKHKRYRQYYNKSEKCKEKYRRYYQRHPDRFKARSRVMIAIRSGRLPKAKTLQCYYCGEKAQEYHHSSYAPEHRLDVVPVCRSCHKGEVWKKVS